MKSYNRSMFRIGLPLWLGIAFAAFMTACDSSPTGQVGTRFESAVSAFAEMGIEDPGRARSGDEKSTRFSARVGPQPWPNDLPERWPQPREATVVATGHRGQGERLILVNWTGKPESAVRFYKRALESIGYAVDRPRALRIRHALHAEGNSGEVVLTFIDRENHTRIEILFLTPVEQGVG